MSVTFRKQTKPDFYNFASYHAYHVFQDGKYVGRIHSHSGFKFWIACVGSKGKTRAVQLKGITCGTLRETKKGLIEVLEGKQPLVYTLS